MHDGRRPDPDTAEPFEIRTKRRKRSGRGQTRAYGGEPLSEARTLAMPAVADEAEPLPLSSSRYSIVHGRTIRGLDDSDD